MLMITIHELGHYLAAKLLKIRVDEFSIGFGKALFKRKSKKTGEVFAIRLIPLGGYCAFEGGDVADGGGHKREVSGDEVYPNRTGILFNDAAPWKRLIVLFAGAFFNFISAIIFSMIFLVAIGYYQGVTIHRGEFNSAFIHENNNNVSRLQEGDIIVEVNGQKLNFFNTWQEVMSQKNAREIAYSGNNIIPVVVIRDGIKTNVVMEIFHSSTDQTGTRFYGPGIRGSISSIRMSFTDALGYGFIFTFQLAGMILVFLWQLVTGQMQFFGNVGGPITTVSVMAQGIGANPMSILILLPLISVNLALFNLLPIPALDGARMVFVGVEWARGKPINPDIEGRIHMVGLFALLAVVLLADIGFLLFGGGVLERLSMLGVWRL